MTVRRPVACFSMTAAARSTTGRPRGEIRLALASAAHDLAIVAMKLRELAQQAGVGYQAARQTACNMVRAGELIVRERRRMPGSRCQLLILAPADTAIETTTVLPGSRCQMLILAPTDTAIETTTVLSGSRCQMLILAPADTAIETTTVLPGSRCQMLILEPTDTAIETTTVYAWLSAIVGGWLHARSPSPSAAVHTPGEQATAESTAAAAADAEG